MNGLSLPQNPPSRTLPRNVRLLHELPTGTERSFDWRILTLRFPSKLPDKPAYCITASAARLQISRRPSRVGYSRRKAVIRRRLIDSLLDSDFTYLEGWRLVETWQVESRGLQRRRTECSGVADLCASARYRSVAADTRTNRIWDSGCGPAVRHSTENHKPDPSRRLQPRGSAGRTKLCRTVANFLSALLAAAHRTFDTSGGEGPTSGASSGLLRSLATLIRGGRFFLMLR
jgi:hypothetical protein